MNLERSLRLLAGSVTLVSLALGWFVSPWFFLLTLFVALNQMQSAFTNWCPAMPILRKAGVRDEAAASCCAPAPRLERIA